MTYWAPKIRLQNKGSKHIDDLIAHSSAEFLQSSTRPHLAWVHPPSPAPISNLISCPSVQSSPTDFVVSYECAKCASTSEPLELLFPLPRTLFLDIYISSHTLKSLPKVSLSVRPAMTILYKIISHLFHQTPTTVPPSSFLLIIWCTPYLPALKRVMIIFSH